MDTVGNRIRKMRIARNLTQRELAARTGIHEVLMRRYEYGDRRPKLNQLEKIAAALGVDVAIFLLPETSSIFAIIYGLMDLCGDITISEHEGECYIGVPSNSKLQSEWNQALAAALKEKELSGPEEFSQWLANADKGLATAATKELGTKRQGGIFEPGEPEDANE